MSIGSWFSGNLGALGTFGSNIGNAIGTTYRDINTPTGANIPGAPVGVNPATGQPLYASTQSTNTSMYLLIGGVALLVVAFVLIMMKRK